MKKMTMVLCLLLAFLFSFTAFAAEPVRVGALKGPTGMGMVQMMDDDAATFTLAGSADEIVPLLVQGKLDIAAIPANLAAVLYASTDGAIRAVAINTLGVMYIVERGDSIQTVADLRGRTIYTAGKGSTPEYALNYILRGNGLEPGVDVTIEYRSEHAECLSAMLSDASAIAMLPQPFVAVAQSKADDLRIALDLTHEWDLLQSEAKSPSSMITGVTVARSEFIDAHPEALAAFMESYANSVNFVLEHPSEAAERIGQFDLFDAAVAEKALPYCNITLITGEDMRTQLSGYLAELYAQDPASVGGSLPDDAFYCMG